MGAGLPCARDHRPSAPLPTYLAIDSYYTYLNMSSGDNAESPVCYEWELPYNAPLSPPTTGHLQSPLCTLCKSLFTDDSKSVISQTGENLKKSAEICQLCYLRWSRLTAAQQDSCDTFKENVSLDSYWPSVDFVYCPQDSTWNSSFGSGWAREKIELLTLPSEPNPLVGSLNHTNNSYPSWEISKKWLSDCLRDHHTCQQWALKTERHLPTRLIDLGSDPNIIRPRICITSKLETSTPYTTLSHCWGKLKILTLMTATLEAMEDRIDVSLLTKTFREAMEATKRLGIQYIWIDSLCIIQDSVEDWLHESKLMSDVYRHAFCSIAVAKSVDGNGGCFTTRNLFDVLPCTVDTSHCLKLRQAAYICGHKYLSDLDMNSSPLLSRAWVVQEVALAPRIIYYSERRTYWQCLQRSVCENGSPWSREAEKLAASIAIARRVMDYQDQDDEAKAKAEAFQNVKILIISGSDYDRWKGAVEAYSLCALTFPEKDKLVAISGLAKAIFPNNPTYLAGLWGKNLTEHLRWTTKQKGCSRAQTYRAPSWSWASIDGPIVYPDIKSNRQGVAVHVHEAHTTLVNRGDPYGSVTDGFIRVVGILTKWRFYHDLNGDENAFRLDGLDCTVLPDDGQPFAEDSTLYCLTLNWHTLLTDGLIIEPSGSNPGEYVRKGYFKFGDNEFDSDEEYGYSSRSYMRAYRAACLDPRAQARILETDYEAKLDDVKGEPSQYVIKLI